MTVYIVITGFSRNSQERAELLTAACRQRNVACSIFESTTANRLELPTLHAGDALYNATRSGMRLEELLWRPRIATFYTGDGSPRGIQDTTRWVSSHTLAHLSQPRTIVHPTNNRTILKAYARELGGFPLILKVADRSLGSGVMIVESFASLLSVTDYLVDTNTEFILRQFIKGPGTGRLMVIGKNVVGAILYQNPPEDFRTGAGPESNPQITHFDELTERLAIEAVTSIGSELGGVDIAFDHQGKPYLLEVNMPCGFASFPRLGIDVPGMMIDHLVTKAKRIEDSVNNKARNGV